MARRRKRRKKYQTRSYQASNFVEGLNFDLELEPHIVREVLAILFMGLGLFTLLAILGVAGNVGSVFFATIRLGFGWTGFVFPLVLAGAGVAMFYPVKYKFSAINTVGLILMVTSISTLLHLFIPQEEALIQAGSGEFGGYVGWAVGWALTSSVEIWAALLIVVVLLVVSALLVFGQPLRELYYRAKLSVPTLPESSKVIVHNIASHRGGRKSKDEDDEDEDGELVIDKGFVTKKRADKDSSKDFIPQVVPSGEFALPDITLLSDVVTKVDSGNIRQNVGIIQESLEDFGIQVEMSEVNVGPTVTQYTLKPAAGIKLSRISNLANDLSLALAAHPIRIEAPIPGRSLVGVEVPNKKSSMVRLREILESELFQNIRSPLRMPLGRDVAGSPIATDLVRMPHLLIAGATGMGKSVYLNSLIVGLLYQNTPADLRLVLVDPKRVEFTPYNNIPHLLAPVIVDPHKTISSLKWLVREMERRYKIFSDHNVRVIEAFNKANPDSKMPYIVLVIDELADLMAVSAREVEAYICRLAQMSRSVGIHLVLATQRPSVDVITGLIKANFPSRIAFAVTSGTDSRTILDTVGADKLLGNGDMLFRPSDASKPRRIQGVYVSDKEIKSVTNFVKDQDNPVYVEELISETKESKQAEIEADGDELMEEVIELVVKTGKASASYLQRRFRIGYARAARLLDLLEMKGVVGPGDGAKAREILISRTDLVTEPDDSGEEEEYVEGEDY
ncbi:MAG: DNA translocase FtsK 4TM domain-containing protein [Patescibacteria group bacterium]|nr:DNA translocase FtsK 4TM domain-containing protein [Patescibacteria group bacterium]